MNGKFLLILIVGSLLQCMYDIFITQRLSEAEARKAKYNCENCKNWKCYYYYCKKKRSELEK